jgi:hypothetical protein
MCLEKNEGNYINISQYIRWTGKDSNCVPPKYESGGSPTQECAQPLGLLMKYQSSKMTITGSWRKFHMSFTICSLNQCYGVVKLQKVSCKGHAPCTGNMRNGHKILILKCTRTISPWILRFRWDDDIKMEFTETGCMWCRFVSGWGPIFGSCEQVMNSWMP